MMRIAVGSILLGVLLLSFDATAQSLDVRLVIDVSGSMKSGDPEYLRQDVLNDLGELLPSGSRAGVWTFGPTSTEVVPHGVVDDAWRRTARGARSTISSTAPRTNMSDALVKAAWDFADASPDWNRHIILVTDGRVDVADDAARNDAQRRAITDDVLPRLRAANIRLDCLALSPNADMDFLKQIAEATHGHVARADSVAAVKQYLATALDGLAPAGAFAVADATAEITLFADRTAEGLVLTTPTGSRIDAATQVDGVKWGDADSYSIVTITSPGAGTWRFAPTDARVQVWNELGIAIRPDDRAEAPTVRAELTEAGKPIDEPRLASAIAIEAELKTIYGSEPLRVTAIDGVPLAYAIDLGGTPLTVADQVTVRAIGKTFERTRGYTERIAHPIDVDVRDAGDGNAGAMVRVNVPEMDAASLRVLGSTRTAGGRVKLVVGVGQTDGAWLVAIPRLEPNVDIGLKIIFNLMNNKKIEVETDPIQLTLPLVEPMHIGLDIHGHVIVDPVRPPPLVATPEPKVDTPATTTPTEPVDAIAAPEAAATASTADAAPQPRTPALWEWIAMGGVGVGSMVSLAWLLMRSRRIAPPAALDLALNRYREALASAGAKPVGAATT